MQEKKTRRIEELRNKYVSITQENKLSFLKIACTRKPFKINEIYCKRCLGGVGKVNISI